MVDHIRWIGRWAAAGAVCVAVMLTAGCGRIFITAPPSGQEMFSEWGLLGDYSAALYGPLVRGMPPMNGVIQQ